MVTGSIKVCKLSFLWGLLSSVVCFALKWCLFAACGNGNRHRICSRSEHTESRGKDTNKTSHCVPRFFRERMTCGVVHSTDKETIAIKYLRHFLPLLKFEI